MRDFIQFAFWQDFPVFNFADVSLCVGVLMFVIYLILYFVKNRKAKIKIEKNDDKTDSKKGDGDVE